LGVEGPVKSPTDEPVAGSGCCRTVGHAFCVELPCRIDRPGIDDVPSGLAVSASERSNEQVRPSSAYGSTGRAGRSEKLRRIDGKSAIPRAL
jgi:hypothetical protein